MHEIIAAEKEMQEYIESESVALQNWLEEVKEESKQHLIEEEEKIKQSFHKAVKEAIHRAEGEASEIVHDAMVRGERLEKLDNETLTRMIMKHLNRILPGMIS